MPGIRSPKTASHPTRWLLLVILLIATILTGALAWWRLRSSLVSQEVHSGGLLSVPAADLSLSFSPTPLPTASTTPVSTPEPPGPPTAKGPPPLVPFSTLNQGLIVISLGENGHHHLFAYRPPTLPLLRLTSGEWDDISPAFSPDGSRLAFASNRTGYWELYLMTLANGELTRISDSPEYKGHPSWSPDGRWLAYESYQSNSDGGSLEIFIRPLDGSSDPIRLSDGTGSSFSPSWSPKGRTIAFVSTRSGVNKIWLANLDNVGERFIQVSRLATQGEAHPDWSQDGSQLMWSSLRLDGTQRLYILDTNQAGQAPREAGNGDWAAFSPQQDTILASVSVPNQVYLTAYDLQVPSLAMPPIALNGELMGLTWGNGLLPDVLPQSYEQASQETPAVLWEPAVTPVDDLPQGRQRVVPLEGVTAPNPMLHDQVDEAFTALRQRVANDAGWDFLSSLEYAFVPLTTPLDPGMQDDWLHTGRAFSFNPLPVSAGWVVITRQDFGSQTYWRVYLRARFQDGRQGLPLHDLPWDINARYGKNPREYEQGGALLTRIPDGYWIDFTELAQAYGWERLPALNSWRASYPSARFNEFVLRNGLDWLAAMQEIYPEEALATPTPIPTPTSTPTITPRPTMTPWYTSTPRPTATPYMSRTPGPSKTPWPTTTPTPTNTRMPTRTLNPVSLTATAAAGFARTATAMSWTSTPTPTATPSAETQTPTETSLESPTPTPP